MITIEMHEAAREVARRHGATLWSVLMLAAALCGRPWRDCIPVTVYRPRKSDTHWKTPVEYSSLT